VQMTCIYGPADATATPSSKGYLSYNTKGFAPRPV